MNIGSITGQRDINEHDGCRNLEWTFSGMIYAELYGYFNPAYYELPDGYGGWECEMVYTWDTVPINFPGGPYNRDLAGFGPDVDITVSNCPDFDLKTYESAHLSNRVTVTFGNGSQATIGVWGEKCGAPIAWCGEKDTVRTFNLVPANISFSGDTIIPCTQDTTYYTLNGGTFGDITIVSDNSNWDLFPVIDNSVFPPVANQFGLVHNNGGDGTITITSANRCDTVTYSQFIDVQTVTFSPPTGLSSSNDPMSLCVSSPNTFSWDDMSTPSDPVLYYEYEFRNGSAFFGGGTTSNTYTGAPINNQSVSEFRVRAVYECGVSYWTSISLSVSGTGNFSMDITLENQSDICSGVFYVSN